MKLFFSLLTALMLVAPFAKAQNPERVSRSARVPVPDSLKNWHYSGLASLNFNQMQFSNWAAGGENNISLALIGNFGAYYAKDRWAWDNVLDFGLGIIKPEDQKARKNEDRWSIISKAGYKIKENLFASARLDLRSQFIEGFNLPPNDSVRISNFFAPAVSMISLGLEYKPLPELAIGFYPISNRTTFVLDDALSRAGAFGVKPGDKIRMETLGAAATIFYKKQFGNAVQVQSRAELFNYYLDPVTADRGNIKVNWETIINFKPTKYLGVSFFLQVMYDHNVAVPLFREVNGIRTPSGAGPRTQLKQMLGVSLSYQFDTRPKK